jgi:predicted esterase
MTKIGYFKTTKTARYAQLNEFSEQTNNLWIVLHGYGQLVPYFIRKFECFANPQTVVIAPEGLHRFYLTGATGRVGASWMTKEERLQDINDYIFYLDNLLHHLLTKNLSDNYSVKINLLGFSQGGATVCRWAINSIHKINKLVLYSSVFPPDITLETEKLKKIPEIISLMGTNDEYVSVKDFESTMLSFKQQLPQLNLIIFEGKHEILPQVLMQLA